MGMMVVLTVVEQLVWNALLPLDLFHLIQLHLLSTTMLHTNLHLIQLHLIQLTSSPPLCFIPINWPMHFNAFRYIAHYPLSTGQYTLLLLTAHSPQWIARRHIFTFFFNCASQLISDGLNSAGSIQLILTADSFGSSEWDRQTYSSEFTWTTLLNFTTEHYSCQGSECDISNISLNWTLLYSCKDDTSQGPRPTPTPRRGTCLGWH